MGLLPNIYYHARTPATSSSGEYTFSRLADATARQNRAQVTWTNDSSPRDPHGYMILSDELPRIDVEMIPGSSRYQRMGCRPNEGSRQARVAPCGAVGGCAYPRKAGPPCVNRQLAESRSTPEESLYGSSYSGDPAWTAQKNIRYPCQICCAPRFPGPPIFLARYPDTASQPTQFPPWAQSRMVKQPPSGDNAWELDSDSDGGVPLEDSQSQDMAVVVEEIVRVIENLQAGYLADTEDGGNGYETYDGDDYSEDGCSGEDSDDTVRAWES